MEIVIGIILIIASVFLIAAVLMQEGKGRGLSGAISGGSSDTFLGKSGSASMQKKLSRLTTIVAIIFVVLVLVMYLMQGLTNPASVESNFPVFVFSITFVNTFIASTAPLKEGLDGLFSIPFSKTNLSLLSASFLALKLRVSL